jgi:hypothetical protein
MKHAEEAPCPKVVLHGTVYDLFQLIDIDAQDLKVLLMTPECQE